MNGASRPGYEARDAQVKWLAMWVGLLVLLIGGVILATRGFDRVFSARRAAAEAPPHPMSGFRQSAPGPELQALPREDYAEYAARERAEISSYGWIDAKQGVVRVPIERAMELVLERGLPAREGSETPR